MIFFLTAEAQRTQKKKIFFFYLRELGASSEASGE
jgi:hypothetical protein